MEWDQITEKWALMTRRLCQDNQAPNREAGAPRAVGFTAQGGDAPSAQSLAGTNAPVVSASPDQ